MIQTIPVREDNIFAFKVTGTLTDADYQQFLPKLTALIEKHGAISLLIELDDFHGWEAKAAWDDFKFGIEHNKDFTKIAIVGENRWQKWMSVLANAFISAKVQSFTRDNIQDAWNWLRQEKQLTTIEQVSLLPYNNIAVAVDFSAHSNLVLKRALELAQHYNSSLSLIHVIEHVSHMRFEFDLITTAYDNIEMDQVIFDNSVKHLDKVASNLNYPNIKHKVLWGSPKSTILSYALAQDIDLIVVGSHGRHGLARLLGSTAHGVVHNAKCDVIVVKLSE